MADFTTAEQARPSASQRDPAQLRNDFQSWLRRQCPDAKVSQAVIPSSNGFSSETMIVDAQWSGQAHRLVVRIAPQPQSSPVFPHYDMRSQFLIMQQLHGSADGPEVPEVLWCEDDPGSMGAPFFVMAHVDGRIPPDSMPYNFGGWLVDASAADRKRLQENTIDQLARVHKATPTDFTYIDRRQPGETALQAHVRRAREYYEWTKADTPSCPLIDRGFAWLDDHWPAGPTADDGATVLNWGDARIGNIIYRDFDPVALLDWEMAALGPRELDVSWMIFFHRFFEDLAHTAGLAGLPGLLRRGDTAEMYAAASGHTLADLDFYITYAALRQAITLVRVQTRAIDFGHAERPENPDEMILHRDALTRMLDGTYWGPVEAAMTGL